MHSDFTGDKWFLLMNTEQQWIVWMQREDSTAPLPGLFLRLWNYEIAVSSWRFVSFYIRWDCCSLISFSCLGTFHWDKVFYSLKGQHLIPYIFLRRKMQTSLLKDVSQVLTGGVSLPNILCGDLCPWATLESHCWSSFCSLPLSIRRAPCCWSNARHLLYYLVNVMDASFSASLLFGAKMWDCKLGGD